MPGVNTINPAAHGMTVAGGAPLDITWWQELDAIHISAAGETIVRPVTETPTEEQVIRLMKLVTS